MSTSGSNGAGEAGARPDSAPSLTLLTKLMLMTTSSNDNEALIALRKANQQAAKFGGWADILKGRITVIGDPFASTPVPPQSAPSRGFTVPDRPQPKAAPAQPSYSQTRQTYQPKPKPQPSPNLNAQRINQYPGRCAGCSTNVAVGAGMARRNINNTAWDIWCSSCLKVGSVKAPRPAVDISDILNRI